ncbi:argininosuccinate lyase [Amycolatopsis sp. WAC 01375]|uniref:ATP-grasp domain-containing protein n=1 Tax=Amycolatopsis sp. WAC 01375 TaxID=2203194 RepID=UPI000F7AB984|nr:ATP-grasp domain-containing protein [Amycolatopsis sp. WAC 01375]RSM72052.1 argininosuccinate lyase [Amycolatopsis sp. WAC 01375]
MTVVLLEALTFGLGRLADAAADAGRKLVLFTGNRDIYRYELGTLGPDRVEVVDIDTTDIAACEAALRAIPDLAGIINSTDTWALPGAELTARLGLPGPDAAAVRVLRDKGSVRDLLYEHGLTRGRPVPVMVAEELGFPLVVKDSSGTSSRGVWLVRDRDELERARLEANETPLKGHLIAEPYFAGPLYSAETVTWQGRTRLLGILSRQLSPEPVRREEAAAFPVAFPEAEYAGLADWIGRVLKAAGHEQGFAHTEFVLTADGPEVVEINIRIGGAMLGEALCRSLDTNVYSAMIDMALGEEPALLTQEVGGGPGIGFVLAYPAAEGVLKGWSGLDRLPGLPGAPEWYPTASPGDEIRHLTDQRSCTGIVLAEGPTAELALHRALAAAGGITAEIES